MNSSTFLASDVCYFPVPNRCLIEIQGVDSAKVVNNMSTNDIQMLAVDECTETFVTDLRGWVVAHGIVVKQQQRILLLGVHDDPSRVCEHLNRYIIREDAQVHDLSSSMDLILVDGSYAQSLISELGDATVLAFNCPIISPTSMALCFDCMDRGKLQLRLEEAGMREGTQAEFQLKRIGNFWPLRPDDISGKTIPQELDRDKQAISFTKGCYLGQETIARLDARGQLQKKLCLVEVESLHPSDIEGGMVLKDEKEVGQVTSLALDESHQRLLGLAFLRRGNFDSGTQLSCNGRTVRVLSKTA